jgi:copper chaperone
MPTEIIDVDGMSCNHCVQTIKDAVGGIPAVKRVEVLLNEKEVIVDYEGGQDVIDTAKAAIKGAGFDIV